MSYVNDRISEIIKTKDIVELKKILCSIYIDIQMDSFVRQEFENEL